MRKICYVLITVSLVILFTGCDWVTDPEPIPDPTPPADYELVWSDEFDQRATTLDESKWSYDLGYGNEGWGNDEWQLYTDDVENIKVENGNMVITALWDSTLFPEPGKRDGSITSARVNTKNKFSMKYGKIQARIKPPTGKGMWPAFWMLGNDYDVVGWPYCGEIDIMEISPFIYNDKTTMFTLHWWDDVDSTNASYGTTKQFNVSLSDDYHIFDVEWDQQRIIGKVDGITYFVKVVEQGTMDEFFRKFFIILNVAVGGNLGGAPDESTQWPQHMYVDWIRAYQKAEEPIESFGIFTDETPVDDGLQIGVDAEIYVWENTLTTGTIPPYEGDNVISWATTGAGWFGGGISSNQPVDLSIFEGGSIKFMIKIPADVSFKIGINDLQGVENYVEFPANQTTFGLVRDGEWGQAVIPVEEIKGVVDLEMLKYEFIILEQNGTQCEFALDDIYWDGGGTALSNVHFDADTYETDATNATISVLDEASADSLISVTVDNGTDTISINITLNGSGNGTGTLNFGPTDDETDTIEIQDEDTLTVTYIDAQGNVKNDTAIIVTGEIDTFGIFTDLTPVDAGIQVGENAEIYVWEGTLTAGTIPPFEGDNVISWETTGLGWFGGGIASYQPVDLSDFELGYIKFMIKIPANVTFKIGINDTQGHENYVEFPANQTTYNLIRNGEWGQAAIPVVDIKGSVNLEMLNYEFMILEQNGTQCAFAVDDIFWDKTGVPFSNVSFDSDGYVIEDTGASITVVDELAVNNLVSVDVDNGTETISVDVQLDAAGEGSSNINFGPTNDETDTIAITEGGTITVTYVDNNGITRTDSADIEDGSGAETAGIYSESHTDPMIPYSQIINSADWSGNSAVPDEQSTAVTPVDGTYVLSVIFENGGATYGGISFDFGSADISSYETLVLSIDKSAMPDLVHLGVKLEDNSAGFTEKDINSYTPEINGGWARYEIPLSDFPSADLSNIKYLGLWNPKDSTNNLLFSTLYFDDIHLEK